MLRPGQDLNDLIKLHGQYWVNLIGGVKFGNHRRFYRAYFKPYVYRGVALCHGCMTSKRRLFKKSRKPIEPNGQASLDFEGLALDTAAAMAGAAVLGGSGPKLTDAVLGKQ